MRFLKTLQKRETEQPSIDDRFDSAPDTAEVVSGADNLPPGFLALGELRIGAPKSSGSSAAVTQIAAHAQIARPEQTNVAKTGIDTGRELNILTVDINPDQVNPRVVSITQPGSIYCEEYRSLRTQILHKAQKRKLQSIVIVSAGPSEGKSVTALNLSWLFAQTDGVRALLIDSDLRLPSLAGYLGIQNETGLSDVLIGTAALTDAIVQLQPAGLYVLPGGTARPDVAELISGPRFAEILKEAKELFDYIIIDAPPLGIFTDAAVLINLADGALLVVKANQTSYKDIDRVLDTLPRERILGTVLNQSEDTLMDESYYKYGAYDKNAMAQ